MEADEMGKEIVQSQDTVRRAPLRRQARYPRPLPLLSGHEDSFSSAPCHMGDGYFGS